VSAKVGDTLIAPGRARSIWAANTADAVRQNGHIPVLLGRTNDQPYDIASAQGCNSISRVFSSIYNVPEGIELAIPNARSDFTADDAANWEMRSDYLDELLKNVDVAHIRDGMMARKCFFQSIPFIYEDHNEDYHENISSKDISILRDPLCRGVLAITPTVAKRLEGWGLGDKTFVADSGVNVYSVERDLDRVARCRRFILGHRFSAAAFYGGGLQTERGIDKIFEAARLNPHIHFLLAGGVSRAQNERRDQRNKSDLKNLSVLGFLDQSTVMLFAQSSDVLVFTRAKNDRSQITSPLKVFEYLASGSPLVSYKLKVIENAIGKDAALTFYSGEDGASLSKAINKSLRLRPWRLEGYEQNVRYGMKKSWKAREQRILERLCAGVDA
jgi:glycosyltransferase involved in cell wall biosynthesis